MNIISIDQSMNIETGFSSGGGGGGGDHHHHNDTIES